MSVTDPLTGLSQTIATLAPAASSTVNTTYTTTLNDLNAGSVINTARASVNFGGTSYSSNDNETVTADQNPEITITKTAAESSYTQAGDIIHYNIEVSNTGNVTLTNVLVTDPNTILVCSGAPYTLAPGATRSCTATRTVTAADITSGSIDNTAAVSGNDPNNQIITDNSNIVTVRLNNQPPVLSCPASVTENTDPTTCEVLLNSGLSATFSDPNNNITSLTWVMTGANNDSSPVTGINNLTSHIFNAGVTTITYTVTDGPGLSATCSFNVTIADNIPPTINCPGHQDRYTDTDAAYYSATGTEFDPVVWDNCTVESMTNDFNGLSSLDGAKFPMGTTNVVWTVTDNFGGSAVCNFSVTVTDNVNPVALCRNITILLDLNTGKASISVPDIDAGSHDNVGIASMTLSKTEFSCTDLGDNNVTLTVTDGSGNIGTCTSVVTVNYAVMPAPSC